jgi:hypothetical protein
LNLASITGVSLGPCTKRIFNSAQRKSRITQAEKLYSELIAVCSIASAIKNAADSISTRNSRDYSRPIRVQIWTPFLMKLSTLK